MTPTSTNARFSPFLSCCLRRFQSESWCTTIQSEMSGLFSCKSNLSFEMEWNGTPFLILNFLDFDVYVVMTPIFPANQRRCASSSKNVAILSLWSKRAIIALNNLIDSHHYKRHKKIRMTEFHSPSLSILISRSQKYHS